MVQPEKIPVFFDYETGETIFTEVIDSGHSENGSNTTTTSSGSLNPEDRPDISEAIAVGIKEPEELARICGVSLEWILKWLKEQQHAQQITEIIPHKSTTQEITHSDSDDGYPSSESSVKSEDPTSSELTSALQSLELEYFHVLDSFFVKFPNPGAEDVENMAAALNISPTIVYEFQRMQKMETARQSTCNPWESTSPPPLKKCKVEDENQFSRCYQEPTMPQVPTQEDPESWMTADALQLILADKEQELTRLLKENEELRAKTSSDSESKDDKIRILERKLGGLEDKCEDLEEELRDCRRRLQNLEGLQNLEEQLQKCRKSEMDMRWRCEQQEKTIERLTHLLEAERVLDAENEDSRLLKKLAVKDRKIESLLYRIQEELRPKIKNQELEILDYDETMKKMNLWRVEDRQRIQKLTIENQGFRSTTEMLLERNLEYQEQHREILWRKERRIRELKAMVRELTE